MSARSDEPLGWTPRGSAGVLLSAIVFLLIVLPFLGRAHSVDDPLYLAAARHVLDHPLDPLGGASFWHDRPATLFDDLYNPPIVAYVLAVPMAIAGGSETAVHLTMVLLALLALAGAAAAGRQLGVAPRATLLLATSPALALAAVSAMADVPFLLLTVLAYLAALRARSLSSGALAGLAVLTKYSGVLGVVPVAVRLRGRGRLLSLAVAAVVCGAWCIVSLALYGRLHPGAASRFLAVDGRLQLELLASFVASVGLVGLPAALGLLRWDPKAVSIAALGGVVGAWGIGSRVTAPGVGVVAFVCCASGGALLLAAARASWRTRDGFLITAFWLPALYSMTLVYFGAARYLLPTLPPLVWLLDRGGAFVPEVSPRRWALSAASGAGLCLALLWGDAGYADAWRTEAGRLPAATRGFEVGHWGFQWYAGRRGYSPLAPREELRAGDVVAEAVGIYGAGPSPAQRAVLAAQTEIAVASPPVRVMDQTVAAGLYSSAWGVLPFGYRRGATEVVTIGAPAPWLEEWLAERPVGSVVLDMGSAEAHWTELDGWSGDEGFDDGGVRRSFVWTVGPEAALRVSLPAGLGRIAVRAFPSTEAEGPLELGVGPSARATITLAAGWRTYEAAVAGTVEGGPTTIVLRPSGHRRPGLFARERRELALAVDGIAFGERADPAGPNRGTWPVVDGAGRPSLFVAEERRR